MKEQNYLIVDLGLPSGLKWADRNVGAETPQDNGLYFSWGNVDGHTVDENGVELVKNTNYYYINLKGERLNIDAQMTKENVIDGYSFDRDTYPNTLGGQYTGSTLDAEHDAATVNMGSDWRMPTSAETLELVQNTDHYYIGESGNIVAGPFDYGTNSWDKGLVDWDKELLDVFNFKLRSICFVKKGENFNYNDRSNFIEFPFAGACSGPFLRRYDLAGYILSSSVDDSDVKYVRFLDFDKFGHLNCKGISRHFGFSVRGVTSNNKI